MLLMKWAPFLLPSLVVVGCGGGGNGSSPSSGPAQTSSFGPVSLEGFVYADPVRASGSGTSIVGLAGDFSSIVYQNPNPRVEQTQFVYSEGRSIHVLDYDGGNPREAFTQVRPASMSFSPGGGQLYFSDVNYYLRTASIGGGSAAIVGLAERRFAMLNPNGTRIAFLRRISSTTVHVYRCNPDGTNEVQLPGISSSADPTGLAWLGNNRILWGHGSTVVVADVGGLATPITGFLPGDTNGVQILGSSRDGRIAYLERDAAAGGREIVMLYFDPGMQSTPLGVHVYDINKDVLSLSVSPDRRQVVTLEVNEGATPGNVLLIRRNFDLTVPVNVRSLPPVTEAGVVGWQPFPTNRVLAGAASLFGGNASAFVWATSGNEIAGHALVRAQTPNTTRIDAEGAAGTNLVYAIECDRITKASISVDKGQALSNLNLTATTNGLLANFNSATGEVMAAIPYTVTRGTGKPKVSREGTRVIVEGAMQGVYDAKGKNLAPSGATRAVLENGGRITVDR